MVIPTTLWIPVVDAHIQLGFAYYILAFLIIVGATNAVNLTDGLDGLASGTSAVAAIAFSVIGLMIYSTESSVAAESVAFFGSIVTAVCLGFWYLILIQLRYLWAIQAHWLLAAPLQAWLF